MLATPCQNTAPDADAPKTSPRVRASVLCLINRVRAEHGLQPLTREPASWKPAAEGHGSELVAEDYFAHVSPSGVTPVERIKSDRLHPRTRTSAT